MVVVVGAVVAELWAEFGAKFGTEEEEVDGVDTSEFDRGVGMLAEEELTEEEVEG